MCVCVAQPKVEFENWPATKMNFEENSGLDLVHPLYSFLVARHTQHHGDENTGTGNGNHVCMVIQLPIAIATLCFWCDFSVLLLYSRKSKCHETTII